MSKFLIATDTTILIHLAATWFLVGLIWIIQIVHYPLFAEVGEQNYSEYQRLHEQRITWVVGPLMLIEIATAFWLALRPPAHLNGDSLSSALLWTGVALVVLIWLTTAFVSVPCHAKLSQGFDLTAHQRLVSTNWIRTIAWSLRGVLVLLLLQRPTIEL